MERFSATVVVVIVVVVAVSLVVSSPSCDSGTCGADNDSSMLSMSEKFLRGMLLLTKSDQSNTQNTIHHHHSDGIFVSIKTTLKYHSTRLPSILLTWLQNLSPSQIHLVTDSESYIDNEDTWLNVALNYGFSVIYSNCSVGHQRESLCCKSGTEYEQYYNASEHYRWFCHFDDDIYVNVPNLVSTLSEYNPLEDSVYIGRWPLASEAYSVPGDFPKTFSDYVRKEFRYATGAAYCVSTSLMEKVEHYLKGKRFVSCCQKLRLTDDMLVGCVIGAVLGYNLTSVTSFNSNINPMSRFSPEMLKQQVTVSYGTWTVRKKNETTLIPNIMNVNSIFSVEEDPTRFFSYHCHIFPDTRWCSPPP